MQKIQKKNLANGLTVIYKHIPSAAVALEFSVRTGSIVETKNQAGVSHFIEHLLFEGTKKRASSMAIANEIEKYGGEFNAATSQERTIYYIKIAKRYFSSALDILYDMFTNSLFDAVHIEKERKIILDEINMVNDNPHQYQWILFNKRLFSGHAAGLPVYGNAQSLKALTQKDILAYFCQWYIPQLITIVIVGDAPHALSAIAEKCSAWKKKQAVLPSFSVPTKNVKTLVLEKKKLNQSYLVLGYKTVPRYHSESYVFDIMCGILGRGQSGWLFNEIRAKLGLCYAIGIEYDANKYFGDIGIFCGTSKQNIPAVEKLIFKQLERLKSVSEKDVAEAKTFIAGNLALRHENSAILADEMAYWHETASLAAHRDYLDKINKVSVAEVRDVAKKYFTKNYTLAVLEQMG